MVWGLVPVSFGRYSDPFQSPGSLIAWPGFFCPNPTSSRPYRIIPPDQTICLCTDRIQTP